MYTHTHTKLWLLYAMTDWIKFQYTINSFGTGTYYTGYTQRNGAVSKVNKKFISHLTRAQMYISQQWQLSKFLMRYQQFASHAYSRVAGSVSKAASQQEKAFCALRFEVSRSVITVQREFRARFRKKRIPHFHRNVRVLLDCVLQQRWTRRAAKRDNHLFPWPPRSRELTPRDFFLWRFVKDSVCVPPLPTSLKELRDRVTHALQTVTADMPHRVWDGFDYHVDVRRVTYCAHIEGLWLMREKLGQLPLLTVYVVPA